MENYEENRQEEIEYLEKTLVFIRNELDKETEILSERKMKLIASRKDMWDDTVHSSNDFDKLTEANQYLSEVNIQTANYYATLKYVEKYKRMIETPYFGRFDFVEDGSDDIEKIYIGISNVMDLETHDIFIYDWRAPISAIYYQYELGKVSYKAPVGTLLGDMLLKRQYKIQKSQLKYFFDCNIRISDEILQEVLFHNSSEKMKSIVETIQKEQDIIIRDTDNELLIVQGVAGSGKTSIALHRIAFLLYEGLHSNTKSNNIIIISPNNIFSKYISSILPELGEENVEQTTYDDIAFKLLEGKNIESRQNHLESLIVLQNHAKSDYRMKSIKFKGSRVFTQIIDRLITYCERRMIIFDDIYYDGKILETKQQIKNYFLNNKVGIPISKRLERIKSMIFEKIHILKKERLEKIVKIVKETGGHEFYEKSFSRLLVAKESKAIVERINRFTEIDYFELYRELFRKEGLFLKLAQGLELPADIEQIIVLTQKKLEKGIIPYEDCAPLLYLKLSLEGNDLFGEIKQVVIDEAQDYYPIQYEVFKRLFKDVRYTILGDINQAIEKDVDTSVYSDIGEIFNKKKSVKLFLNKSFRSSYEINIFNQRLLNESQELISFERHEQEPKVVFEDSVDKIESAIVQDMSSCLEQGYESIAVVCKTAEQAKRLYDSLKNQIDIKLVDVNDSEIEKGVIVIPAYMAKGLEFDVVFVYDVSRDNYSSELDKKLLYIACTRALHRLGLYYTGDRSDFV